MKKRIVHLVMLVILGAAAFTNANAEIKTVNVSTAGTLADQLTLVGVTTDYADTLVITGNLKPYTDLWKGLARGYYSRISKLDLSGSRIIEETATSIWGTTTTYPADELPEGFMNFQNCQTVILPNNLKSIATDAFRSGPKLSKLVLPASLEEIKDYAFDDVYGTNLPLLTSLTLPANIKKVSLNLAKLTSVNIPTGVTYLNLTQTSGLVTNDGVLNATIPASVKSLNLTLVPVTSVNLHAGLEYVNLTMTNITSVSLPASVKTAILNYISIPVDLSNTPNLKGFSASNNTSLTTLTVPASVDSLVLDDCSNLTSVNFPAGIRYVNVMKAGLTSVTVPASAKVFMAGAVVDYSPNNALTSAVYQQGVDSIGEDMNIYTHCAPNLTSVTLPNSVVYIGYHAFDATGLTSLDFVPSSVKHIGDYSFQSAPLSEVVLKEGLQEIGEGAFFGCSNIKKATLPSTLEFLGANAFIRNPDITDVYSYAEEPPVADASNGSAFDKTVYTNAKLHVVSNEAKDAYAAEPVWKEFAAANVIVDLQNITGLSDLNKKVGDPAFDLSGVSSSGLDVAYASSNTGVATVSGKTVTITGAGVTTITATQAGNTTWQAARPVTFAITVTSASGINEVHAQLPIRIQNGNVIVIAEGGSKVEVYNALGVCLQSKVVSGTETVINGLPKGQVLIIRNGNAVAKVIL